MGHFLANFLTKIFGRFLLTHNLLTIASFRIRVPALILFCRNFTVHACFYFLTGILLDLELRNKKLFTLKCLGFFFIFNVI